VWIEILYRLINVSYLKCGWRFFLKDQQCELLEAGIEIIYRINYVGYSKSQSEDGDYIYGIHNSHSKYGWNVDSIYGEVVFSKIRHPLRIDWCGILDK
jgi:hypothetical protein